MRFGRSFLTAGIREQGLGIRWFAMRAMDLLLKKRDGLELSTAEIEFFVRAVVRNGESKLAAGAGNAGGLPLRQAQGQDDGEKQGETSGASNEKITDAQLGAFLMAVFERGLSLRELGDLDAGDAVLGGDVRRFGIG